MKLWAPWVRFAYGAAFDRQTDAHIGAAGLSIDDRRFVHGDILEQITIRTPGPTGSTGSIVSGLCNT